MSRCATWTSLDFAAYACSPSELRKTVANNTLPQHGHFILGIAGYHTGTAPGLVQVVGQWLAPGTTVRLSGAPAADEQITLVERIAQRPYLVTLTHVRMKGAAAVVLDVKRHRPTVRLVRLQATVVVATPR